MNWRVEVIGHILSCVLKRRDKVVIHRSDYEDLKEWRRMLSKILEEYGDKLSEESRKLLETKLYEMEETLSAVDSGEIIIW